MLNRCKLIVRKSEWSELLEHFFTFFLFSVCFMWFPFEIFYFAFHRNNMDNFLCFFLLSLYFIYWFSFEIFEFAFHRYNLPFLFSVCFIWFLLEIIQFVFHRNNLVIFCFLFSIFLHYFDVLFGYLI